MNRRKRVILEPTSLRQLLGLPDNMSITSIQCANEPMYVAVTLESPDFPEISENEESPITRWYDL